MKRDGVLLRISSILRQRSFGDIDFCRREIIVSTAKRGLCGDHELIRLSPVSAFHRRSGAVGFRLIYRRGTSRPIGAGSLSRTMRRRCVSSSPNRGIIDEPNHEPTADAPGECEVVLGGFTRNNRILNYYTRNRLRLQPRAQSFRPCRWIMFAFWFHFIRHCRRDVTVMFSRRRKTPSPLTV